MTIEQVAKAFVAGNIAKCHNANTDGEKYWLHGNCIAEKTKAGIRLNWCGWYTPTTANHMKKIAREYGYFIHFNAADARKQCLTFETLIGS